MTVIPAPPGVYATYKYKIDERKYSWMKQQVVAFDDGQALIVAENGSLVFAGDVDGFSNVEAADDDAYIQIMPAGGWRVEWVGDDDGGKFSEPLVGWAVTRGGRIRALFTDESGDIEDSSQCAGFRIYHPDHEQ